MKKIFLVILFSFILISTAFSQILSELKFRDDNTNEISFSNNSYQKHTQNLNTLLAQVKSRKTVSYYVGAGYSFIFFTNSIMNTGYPVVDVQSGDVVSDISIFFGFAIAKALTLEIEPSYLWTHNYRAVRLDLTAPVYYNGEAYYYDFPSTQSMLAFPLAVNLRFFPFFKLTSFSRLFFVGGGTGMIYISEDYIHQFTLKPYFSGYYDPNNIPVINETSTSQWTPLFRIMTGFTGTGGALGFGGEVRYNFVPLKTNVEPFRTRVAKNYNSFDISLRFYYSL